MEEKQLLGEIQVLLENLEVRMGVRLQASEESMKQYVGEQVQGSEERMGVRLQESEERMKQYVDLKTGELGADIKAHITSNNVAIGEIITGSLETVHDNIHQLQSDVAVLRINDAQKTIDLVHLRQVNETG